MNTIYSIITGFASSIVAIIIFETLTRKAKAKEMVRKQTNCNIEEFLAFYAGAVFATQSIKESNVDAFIEFLKTRLEELEANNHSQAIANEYRRLLGIIKTLEIEF